MFFLKYFLQYPKDFNDFIEILTNNKYNIIH